MILIKLFKLIFVLLFSVLVLMIPTSIYLIKFNQSEIATKFKQQAIQFTPVVLLTNLNDPGDGKYVYAKTNHPIPVTVTYQKGNQPNPEINSWIQDMVFTTLGKDVHINSINQPVDTNLLEFTSADLNNIRSTLTPNITTKPKLNIIYLSQYQETPSFVGIVLHRDTIYIFKQTINQSSNNNQDLASIEQSTLMHEWGHMLGLEHIDNRNCIMSSSFDVFGGGSSWKNNFFTTYCPHELFLLDKLRI